ncbi:MAG: hypothetical protein HY821_16055 [Acidobacteria bacterium]|nr:hypothetical protein [Acidobacteriota bacterium]
MARRIPGRIVIAAIWLLRAAAAQAPPADAKALLERMAASEAANRRNSAYFVFREDIRYTEQLPNGTFRRNTTATYEVSILEGEPYHRRTLLDGRPLDPVEQAYEEKRMREVEQYRRTTPLAERRKRYFAAEENRFKVDSAIVLAHHDVTYSGEESWAGRRCWVIDTAPRSGAPKPKLRSQWSLSQKIRYWIDQETAFPIHLVATQLFDFLNSHKGTVTEITSGLHEGVWLLDRICSEGTHKSGGVKVIYRTDQKYSGYQRFRSTTNLIFDPGPDN